MLMSYHRAAVLASREFWQLLLRSDISLVKLVKACRNIEVMEDKATKTFQSVLERYPRSAKLLRSYAAFLEQVKNDPWAAAKYNR
jgi:tRNA U34 5-carboxymethylaminomethyl modifying enzyme MnmG/GidA